MQSQGHIPHSPILICKKSSKHVSRAFDSVQTAAVLTSLQEQGIEDVYIELIKEIFTNSSMTVHLHKGSNKFNIRRGVRQEDSMLPKLLTATLETIFRRLPWETRGLQIDGEYLSNFCFADDIFICANIRHELQQMTKKLAESENQVLKMNKSKTKVMMENDTLVLYADNRRSRLLKATSTWNRYTASGTITKTRRFKDEFRPGGQHSPSSATSSRITLEHA